MTATLPLLPDAPADAVFAWRRGEPITRARFLADVQHLARALPHRGHVLNVCTDRYRFAVGLAAALMREQVSLLPPSTHAATVRQLVARFPDTYCLAETAQADIDLPQTLYDDAFIAPSNVDVGAMPRIPVDRTVACVFTSGSTGVPTMHRKRWGSLVVNVRSEAERLMCDGRASPIAIVATVPPQHMYGFESSLLMAWQSGAALVAERPFYPADIVAALERIPGRRLLVTTPFHLRALIEASDLLPAVDCIVCATAPLSQALAATVEQRFGAPVLEVYGCTETGQLATRRTTQDPRWQLLGSIDLAIDANGQAIARGGHIEEATPLSDVLEAAPDFATTRLFSLVGRSSDLVNIAGKRTSLGHLDVQLNAIDGVIDGVFVMPDDDRAAQDGVTRLAAVVVAPTLDSARLLAALRERIDAVFLPRPIHFVDSLPRNATGKLTQARLQRLLADAARRDGHDSGRRGASPR
jgi:acyl-coenzyme A synthetase/AMP-(fatty) acid ligase